MSQHVKVEQGGAKGRGLEFTGAAVFKPNIYGNPMFAKCFYYNDFLGIGVDETNDWASNESHGGTAAINAAKGGTYRLTTSTTNGDKSEVAKEICWYATQAPAIFVRIKVDAITTVRIVCGFADAKSFSDNQTAFEISGTTITDRGTNGVCWVFDTDADSDYWYMCNTNAGSAAGTSAAVAPVEATYETLGIGIDTLGNATFYRNNARTGFKALAVATTGAFAPYVAVQSLAGSAARNLDLHRIFIYQDEN